MQNIVGFIAIAGGLIFSITAVYNPSITALEIVIGLFVGLGVATVGSLFVHGNKLFIAAAIFLIALIGLLVYGLMTFNHVPGVMMTVLAIACGICFVRATNGGRAII
jgi:hypothetical protein